MRLSAVQSYCILANNLWVYAPLFLFSFFYQLYSDKAKTESLIGTAPPLHAPPEIFLECNHFKIQAAQLPPEEHEYFTLCKWGARYEFLDGSDYDTVISATVMWWLSLLCRHQRQSITAHVELINMIRKRPEVVFQNIKHWHTSMGKFTRQCVCNLH